MSAQLSEGKSERVRGPRRGLQTWTVCAAIIGAACLLLLAAACVAAARGHESAAQQPAPTPTRAAAHDPGRDFFFVEGPVEPGYLHCSKCHEPLANELESWMPHPAQDRENCLLCHSTRSAVPFDESHNAIFNQTCQLCHEPARVQQ